MLKSKFSSKSLILYKYLQAKKKDKNKSRKFMIS